MGVMYNMSGFQEIFKHAKPRLQTQKTKKQDLGVQNLNIPSIAALTFVSMLGHFSHNYLQELQSKEVYELKNEDDCGIVTGGREECHWDCEIVFTDDDRFRVRNPECVKDCFPPYHCANSLIDDYLNAGGICDGSLGTFLYPGVLNTVPCVIDPPPLTLIGLCSEKTEEKLSSENKEECL